MTQVNEWTCRRIRNRYTHLFSAVIIRIGTEIEIVLVAAVLLLHLYGCRSPEIAVSPGNLVALGIEHHTLVLPLLQVGRRIYVVFISTPSRFSIGGRIDVVLTRFVGIQDFRVGMETWQDWVAQSAGTLGGWSDRTDGSISIVSHRFDDNTALVASAIMQGTIMREEEPLVVIVYDGWMGGIAVAGNLTDDALGCPRTHDVIRHGVCYLLWPA